MAVLDFLLVGHEHSRISGITNFWDLEKHEIPDQPGAYILIAQSNQQFHYPCGSSPIFYIGQSTNLRRRLREHLKYSRQARDDRQRDLYWPRYEFTATFGGRYCFIRSESNTNPKRLEEELFARFAKKHRSFPIANGAGSWRRIAEIIGEF